MIEEEEEHIVAIRQLDAKEPQETLIRRRGDMSSLDLLSMSAYNHPVGSRMRNRNCYGPLGHLWCPLIALLSGKMSGQRDHPVDISQETLKQSNQPELQFSYLRLVQRSIASM